MDLCWAQTWICAERKNGFALNKKWIYAEHKSGFELELEQVHEIFDLDLVVDRRSLRPKPIRIGFDVVAGSAPTKATL